MILLSSPSEKWPPGNVWEIKIFTTKIANSKSLKKLSSAFVDDERPQYVK